MSEFRADLTKDQFDEIAKANGHGRQFNAALQGNPATLHPMSWHPITGDDGPTWYLVARLGRTEGFPDAAPAAQAIVGELTWRAN